MPTSWEAPSIDTSLPSAIGQASDESRAVLAACIETARNQRCFYDAARQSPEDFRASLAHYNLARYELFSTLQWLKEMLPEDGPDAPVRRGLKQRGGEFAGLPMGMTAQSARLFGDGKRDLLALCLALEADPRASTVAAACRELRPAFCASDAWRDSPAPAIAAALAAVRAQDGSVSTARPIPAAIPVRAAPPVARSEDVGHPPPASETLSRWQANSDGITQRLLAALERLREGGRRHGLPTTDVLNRFAARFVGVAPTGGSDDWVGHMQRFGIRRLEQVLDRLESPRLATAKARGVLEELLETLDGKLNPAALFQSIALYALPEHALSQSQSDRDDERCRQVVRREVAHQANELLAPLSPGERERLIDSEVLVVLDRLGMARSVGGLTDPSPSGLIDLSTDGLVAMLRKIETGEQKVAERAG